MINLLRADLYRLRKSLAFRLFLAMTALFILAVCLSQYHLKTSYNTIIHPERFFFCAPLVVSVVGAAFLPFFLGADHADGTLRNKLIAGHTRTDIYLADLVTSLITGLCFAAVCLGILTLLGIPLLGRPAIRLPALLTAIGISLLAAAVFCSLYTMLAVVIPNRTVAVVASLLLLLALYLTAAVLYGRLGQPEFTDGYTLSVNGTLVPMDPEPNPLYLTGAKRTLFQFFVDVLPSGQVFSLLALDLVHPWLMPLWSLILAIVTTGSGLLIFRKKDIQ